MTNVPGNELLTLVETQFVTLEPPLREHCKYGWEIYFFINMMYWMRIN